jgi:hypothetical protein
MRVYDPRVGKFLSVDPITAKYPELTPYQFASNRSIDGIDKDGEEYMKPHNPKATALLIMGTEAQYPGVPGASFNGFYLKAMGNPHIDVMLVDGMRDVSTYLQDNHTQYQNIIFADHGSGFGTSAQVIGKYQYDLKQLEVHKAEFKDLTKNISADGNVILLGCFTAAPHLNGPEYLKTFSSIVDRPVYGDQAETNLGIYYHFNDVYLGGSPKPVPENITPPSYYSEAVRNAGKWSLAKPDGSINTKIGNIKLNYKGAPSNKLFISPLNPENKPISDWKSVLYNY